MADPMKACPHCSEAIQATATKCPHCREFVDPASAQKPKAEPPKRNALRSCAALLLLIGCAAVLYYLWAPQAKKDDLNRVLAATGVTVTPWIDRADNAMRDMLGRQVNQDTIASSVLGVTHPSGTDPTMSRWTVEKQGQTLAVTIDVAWKGGLLGTGYLIQVVWRCNEAGPIGATVTKDDAPVGQDSESLRRLDDYFRTGVWPALFNNTGGK